MDIPTQCSEINLGGEFLRWMLLGGKNKEERKKEGRKKERRKKEEPRLKTHHYRCRMWQPLRTQRSQPRK